MKSLLLVFLLCCTRLLPGQNADSVKRIKPLLIGTETLAPFSIYLEKSITSKIALKARYLKLIPIPWINEINLQSVLVELKYYFNEVKTKRKNYYGGAYYKQRFFDAAKPLGGLYTATEGALGGSAGWNYINHHLFVDITLGLGLNLVYLRDNTAIPADFRANIGIGFAIY
jgi:hypothetical protein